MNPLVGEGRGGGAPVLEEPGRLVVDRGVAFRAVIDLLDRREVFGRGGRHPLGLQAVQLDGAGFELKPRIVPILDQLPAVIGAQRALEFGDLGLEHRKSVVPRLEVSFVAGGGIPPGHDPPLPDAQQGVLQADGDVGRALRLGKGVGGLSALPHRQRRTEGDQRHQQAEAQGQTGGNPEFAQHESDLQNLERKRAGRASGAEAASGPLKRPGAASTVSPGSGCRLNSVRNHHLRRLRVPDDDRRA